MLLQSFWMSTSVGFNLIWIEICGGGGVYKVDKYKKSKVTSGSMKLKYEIFFKQIFFHVN